MQELRQPARSAKWDKCGSVDIVDRSAAHKADGKAFPKHKPVEWDAGVATASMVQPVHGGANAAAQAIAADMKERRQSLLAERRADEEQHIAMAHAVARPVDETGDLEGRNMLKEVADWVSLPHSCPCVAASFNLESVCATTRGKTSLASLERAWESRHDLHVARKQSEKVPEIDPPSKCRKFRFCVCGLKGRQLTRMWDRMRASMRRSFPKPLLQDWLCGGQVCLAFRGKDPTDPTAAPTILTVYVAYQLLSPWRSTVLVMQIAYESDQKKLEATTPPDLETDLEVVLCPKEHSAGQGFWFMSLEKFTDSLSLLKQWEVLPLRLSDRPRIFMMPAGAVMAILLRESPWLVWKGAEFERANTHKSRTMNGAELDDAEEDVEGEYNDIDEAEGDVADGLDFADELLEMLTHYADGAPANDGSSTDSSSSSSSTSTDSTTSRKCPADATASVPTIASSSGQQVESAELSRDTDREAGVRRRHPQTFQWRGFKFTFKTGQRSYEVTCPYHNQGEATRCTKTLGWAVGTPDEECDAMNESIRKLKVWALRAPACMDKSEHQGRRGLRLEESEMALSLDDVERHGALLPPP
eukprot:3731835-Amphidinium_carterae.6